MNSVDDNDGFSETDGIVSMSDESSAADDEWLSPLIPSASSLLPALMQTGRSITGRIQTWLSSQLPAASGGSELLDAAETLSCGESMPEEMLHSVAVALRKQHEINQVHSQLGRLNSLATVANYVRCRQVESVVSTNQQNVNQLRSQLSSQSSVIRDLTGQVSTLNQDVECQRGVSARLEHDLKQQTTLFQSALHQTRRDIERHQGILTKQQQVVNSLLNSKITKDFFVDVGLLAGSLFVVNSFFVNLPLTLMLSLVPKDQLRKWLRLALKLLMLTRTFTYLRDLGVKYGLHSRVGSLLPYLRQLPLITQSCYRYMSQLEWGRQSTASCSDKTNADSDRPSGMEVC